MWSNLQVKWSKGPNDRSGHSDFGIAIIMKYLQTKYFVKHYPPSSSDWSNKELNSL